MTRKSSAELNREIGEIRAMSPEDAGRKPRLLDVSRERLQSSIKNEMATTTTVQLAHRLQQLYTTMEIEALVPTEADLLADILREVAIEAVEDGITHVAEHLLAEFIARTGNRRIQALLSEIVCGKWSADFVKLLGRMSDVDAATRRIALEQALASPDVELRDAAIQAAENWGDRDLASILRNHRDEVSWLAEYTDRVVKALEG